MILDFESSYSPGNYEYSVAVVGAGAVGTLLAVDLARRGIDVLLIEGGGLGVEKRAQALHATAICGQGRQTFF
ncbi:MAG: FAD-dependent oxidoreductase [Rhodobacterales bacterium]|jgi:2-polyprenyl-6-methoxyphenol hydroxylase-like FAD-dependent oxidoreductase|nr:FAD-dependent monooxygenase [Rhodobacter sp.]